VKSFRFPLERVLDWRALQLRTAEEKLARIQAELAQLHKAVADLDAQRRDVAARVLAAKSVEGLDLRALAAFELKRKGDRAALMLRVRQSELALEQQRKELIDRRRDYRVLEKLKERRREEWVYLADQELEALASDAYLAKWKPK
jgi:flagellar protein FliJ